MGTALLEVKNLAIHFRSPVQPGDHRSLVGTTGVIESR